MTIEVPEEYLELFVGKGEKVEISKLLPPARLQAFIAQQLKRIADSLEGLEKVYGDSILNMNARGTINAALTGKDKPHDQKTSCPLGGEHPFEVIDETAVLWCPRCGTVKFPSVEYRDGLELDVWEIKTPGPIPQNPDASK